MTKNEVVLRLRKELNMPRFNAFIEEKDYSEEEYQKLKTDLQNYFHDYVEHVEADFQGGLKTNDGRK